MPPARPRPLTRPRAGRRRCAISSCGSRALEAALLATPTCQLLLSRGIPPASRDSGPFTPLGTCPAAVSLTLGPRKSVISGHFSSSVTPTNRQLRNCWSDGKTLDIPTNGGYAGPTYHD
jgi:hypothetical protein